MKAIRFDQPGKPDVLYYGDAEDPQPGPDELLVRVRAAGVNRADVLQRMGGYAPPPGASPILGLEIAGEVVSGGDGAFAPGERVMAVVTGGGYAELCAVPVGMALRVPDSLSDEQAACIPEAFLTAHLNLFMLGGLQSGGTVLVHAGGSGVGTAAIQLAKAAGATVITTASAAKLERCRELGADHAIDYKTEDFAQRVQEITGDGVDLVLDFIGAPYWNDNLNALKRGGRLTIIGLMGGIKGDLEVGSILRKSLTVTGTTLRPMPLPQKTALVADFTAFGLDRLARGELRPVLDTVFPLSEAADAHRHMEANANFGKIVLRVDE